MRDRMLIGLAGAKRSGKTSVANALVDLGFHHDSFADPIRRFAAEILAPAHVPPNERMSWLEAHKEAPIAWLDHVVSPRTFMEDLGQIFGRRLQHSELWIRALENRLYATAPKDAPGTVISDVRNANEAHRIQTMGGVIVHITRPGVEYARNVPTERPIDPSFIDFTLHNAGTLADLKDEVRDRLVPSIRARKESPDGSSTH